MSTTPTAPSSAPPTQTGSILPRLAVTLIILGGAYLAITGVQQIGNIVAPLLLTLNLVIVAYPVQAWLTRKGLPPIIGAIVSGLIVFAILIGFFGALAWSLASLIQEIPAYQSKFVALYQDGLNILRGYGFSESQVLNQLQTTISPSNIAGWAQVALTGVGGALSTLVVTITIIFVVIIDSMNVPRMVGAVGRSKPYVARAFTDFSQGVRRYWVVSSIFGVIVAALDVAALMYLGVPLALVWGLLSFLTNYIPNIGFVLGIVPPTLMALLANGPQTAVLVFVAYCVINFVIQSIIQPKFNGDAVGVNATVSLLSLLFWAWALGGLGALLALPATLFVKTVLIDVDPSARWLNAFIASDPDSADPEPDSGEQGGATATKPKDLEQAPQDERSAGSADPENGSADSAPAARTGAPDQS